MRFDFKKLAGIAAGWMSAVWRILRAFGSVLLRIGRSLRRIFRKDSVPNLVLVMAVVSVLVSAGIGAVYTLTAPIIAENRDETLSKAMTELFSEYNLSFFSVHGHDDIYEGRDAEGDPAGFFAVKVSPPAFAGNVEMVVGLDYLRNLIGTAIVSHREARDFDRAVERGIEEARSILAEFLRS